jgi:hypothetical protein
VRVRVWGPVLALALLVSGCSAATLRGTAEPGLSAVPATSTTRAPTTTTTVPVTTTTEPPPPDFQPAIKNAVAAVPDGHVAVAVFDTVTDKMVGSYRDKAQYYTESVVKLLIGLDVLDHGGDADKVAEMLTRSDDATASAFWGEYGTNSIVTTMAAKIGLSATVPPHNPKYWGDSRTTAADLVKVYRYILTGAPAAERAVIIPALAAATEHGADGNNQWFGIPNAVGKTTSWAVKQGWGCCEPSWVLNTTGLVGKDNRYIVVLLVAFTSGDGDGDTIPSGHAAEITAAARALVQDVAQ